MGGGGGAARATLRDVEGEDVGETADMVVLGETDGLTMLKEARFSAAEIFPGLCAVTFFFIEVGLTRPGAGVRLIPLPLRSSITLARFSTRRASSARCVRDCVCK